MAPTRTPVKFRRGRVVRDNLHGISKRSIRKMARQGGLKRIQRSFYETTRDVIALKIRQIMPKAIRYAEQNGRKTITSLDIVYAIRDIPGMDPGMVAPSFIQRIPFYSSNRSDIDIPSVQATTIATTTTIPEVKVTSHRVLTHAAELKEVPSAASSCAKVSPYDFTTRLQRWQAIPEAEKKAYRQAMRANDYDVTTSSSSSNGIDDENYAMEDPLPDYDNDETMPEPSDSEDGYTRERIDEWRHQITTGTRHGLGFRASKPVSGSRQGRK